MSRRNDEVYLRHIRDAIARVQEYTNSLDAQAFAASTLVQDAVIRQVQIIGEASARLSDRFRAEHPNWPWREMKNMRNILVHEYDAVSVPLVWQVAKRDLPLLRDHVIQAISPSMDRD